MLVNEFSVNLKKKAEEVLAGEMGEIAFTKFCANAKHSLFR